MISSRRHSRPSVLGIGMVAASVGGAPLGLAQGDGWESLAPMPRARSEQSAVYANGYIYLIGGLDNSRDGPSEVDRYDPVNDIWTTLDDPMPEVRDHFTAVADGTDIWVCGGKRVTRDGTRFVHVFDSVAETWSRGPDLPENHWGGPACIVGRSLHVLSGASGNGAATGHHWSLDLDDPSADWSDETAVEEPRVHAAAVSLGGKIYLVGGERAHNHREGDTDDVQVYDPASGIWDRVTVPKMPQQRSHHDWATFVHDGKIYSVSGVVHRPVRWCQDDILIYDPGTNEWSYDDPLPISLAGPGATVANGYLYVFGGGENWYFGGTQRNVYRRPIGESPAGDPPTAPVAASLMVNGPRSIRLTWVDTADDETGFRIERSEGSGAFTLIAQRAADTEAFTDTTVTPGLTYRFRVAAYNGDGVSEFAEVGPVTTPPEQDTEPPELTGVAVLSSALVEALFSEAVDPVSSTEMGNYSLSPGGVITAVTSTGLPSRVRLTVEGLEEGEVYTLSATGINDLADPPNAGGGSAGFSLSTWTGMDLGSPGLAGSYSYDGETMTVTGGGSDIFRRSDEGYFVYRQMSGDCTVIAKIETVGDADEWSKAGVMIRETVEADSRHAYVCLTRDNGVEFDYRTAPGGTTGKANVGGIASPYWVRAERKGDQFSVWISPEGESWTVVGSPITIAMGPMSQVGIAVTAHDDSKLTTAVVSGITIRGGAVIAGFTEWWETVGAGGDALSQMRLDTDGDGRNNLAEYVFGGDPASPDPWRGAGVLEEDDGGLVFRFRRRVGSGGAVEVLASGDLISWSTSPDAGVVTDGADGFEEVTLPLGEVPAAEGRGFHRLRVVP